MCFKCTYWLCWWKVKEKRITYIRRTVDLTDKCKIDLLAENERKNKRCKQLRKESQATVDETCDDIPANPYTRILCKLTCNDCDINTTPSISIIEPDCYTNDNNEWKYGGELITCKVDNDINDELLIFLLDIGGVNEVKEKTF